MDEARLHEFMGKLVGDMGAAATLANVIWAMSWGCIGPWPIANP